MVPYDHALLSVRDFGGIPKDYLEIHNFLDQTKFHFTEYPHRMFLHNPLGIKLCEDMFGSCIINLEGTAVAVREIARRHIVQDCGCVPTLKDWVMASQEEDLIRYNRPNKKDLEYLKSVKNKTNE